MNVGKKDFLWLFPIAFISFIFLKGQSWFSDINTHALLEKYSQEEVDHFAKFAFSEGKLKKWKNNIVVGYNNQNEIIDTSTLESILKCIEQLDSLLEQISVSFNQENHNVNIAIEKSLNGALGQTKLIKSYFKIPYPRIRKSEILLLIKNRNSDEIRSTIIHEFTHLIGFDHNYPMEDQSIFNPSPFIITFDTEGKTFTAPTFNKYTGLDSSAIRIMYDADVAIDPGMTKEKFYRKIEKAKREMGK